MLCGTMPGSALTDQSGQTGLAEGVEALEHFGLLILFPAHCTSQLALKFTQHVGVANRTRLHLRISHEQMKESSLVASINSVSCQINEQIN